MINVFQSIIEITKFEMKKNSGTKDKKENIKIKKTPNKKNTKKNKSC